MASVDATDFDHLRAWNGEQSRAFEEISYQLLKHKAPAGTRAIRTGNPDGGVSGTSPCRMAPSGAGRPDTCTASMHSERDDRLGKAGRQGAPYLRKLTFVISSNLGTSKAPRKGKPIKSQREKYDDKIATWQRTVPGADKIEFELIQESDLLAELAKPEHRGRRWFWWGDVVLGHDWLEDHYQQQVDAASEKYRPDLPGRHSDPGRPARHWASTRRSKPFQSPAARCGLGRG